MTAADASFVTWNSRDSSSSYQLQKKTRMAKRRKTTTTEKRKEVLGTRVPVHPGSQPTPYYYLPPIVQLQSELQFQEARILKFQNRLLGERIPQLEATIQSKEEEIKQLEATIQRKDEELEATIKRNDAELEATIKRNDEEMKNKDEQISKDEVTKKEMQAKSTGLEAELAEGEERIHSFQEDLTKHKVLLLKFATSIYTSLRMNAKPK
jgi:chromosome segregation ATPase